MKQAGLIVAGLAVVVVLNVVFALSGPHVVRTKFITGTKTVVSTR